MADAHLDSGGWEWHYDDTSDATKAILTRVVQTGAGTEIDIPTQLVAGINILSIAESCFDDAEGHKITKVLSMPSTVTSIGAYAFKTCSLLTFIAMGVGVTTLGRQIFMDCWKLASFAFPAGVTAVPDTMFQACVRLADVVLTDSITVIDEYAFEDCYSLGSIVIPDSVTTIGAGAFAACPLSSITFLGLVAPTSVGANWILDVPASVRGHAYAASNFPVPGDAWNGLTMGTVLAVSANTKPIFPRSYQVDWPTVITAANVAMDGTGTVNLIFTAGIRGSHVDEIKVKAQGTNVKTALRIFVNNGSDPTVAANNSLLYDKTIAATTASNNSELAEFIIRPDLLILPPSYRLYATIGTAVAAGIKVTVVGGDY